MPAPVASGGSEAPGGPCTHWKSAALSRRTWKTDLRGGAKIKQTVWKRPVAVRPAAISIRVDVLSEFLSGGIRFVKIGNAIRLDNVSELISCSVQA